MIVKPHVTATLTRNEASARKWDVGIVGAGVAGASLAIRLARHGLSVILIESQRFPREKVCGGCLNQRAIALLDDLGVLSECVAVGAVEIDTLRIRHGEREHRWLVPRMLSIRRSTLDSILVRKAIAHGAHYLDQTIASVDTFNIHAASRVSLQLRPNNVFGEHSTSPMDSIERNTRSELRVEIAIVAAGLTRSPLTQRGAWPATIAPQSRIGVQAILPAEMLDKSEGYWRETARSKAHHDLQMLIGSFGYLGVSRADAGYYDFAAALDPSAITRCRSIAGAIDALLDECGLPSVCALASERWKSTPHLTRSSLPVARDRVFLLGDSMGYVEPFTGEGMSWAMAGARWLGDRLHRALATSSQVLDSKPAVAEVEAAWNAWADVQRRQHQTVCQWVANQVRYPARTAWVLRGLDWIPPVRNFLLRKAAQ